MGTDTARINVGRLLSGEIAGQNYIQSANYITGSAGWKLFGNGNIEANDGYFRGDISAATGTFTTGIAIGTSPNWFKVDSDGNMWSGRATLSEAKSNTFAVEKEGVLYCKSAIISGSTISTPTITDIQAGSEIAIQGWQTTLVFTASDYRTVTWSAVNNETITLMDGTIYTFVSGTTTAMSALTYIYLDIGASTTVLQKTDTPANAVGSGKILVAVAKNNPDTGVTAKAEIQAFGGSATDSIILVDNISANSASTNEFISNTAQIKDAIIDNAKISDLAVGKLTAGTISSQAITLAVGAGDGDVYIAAGKNDFVSYVSLGGSTTRFDITNPAGNTMRYTYDGTGTDPNIVANVSVGQQIAIQALNFASANNGTYIVTAVDTNYFEITNASGSAESDKTIGTGYLRVSFMGFIIGIDDSDSDLAKFYIGGAEDYFAWTGSAVDIQASNFRVLSGNNFFQFNTSNGILEVVSEGASGSTLEVRVAGTSDSNDLAVFTQSGLGRGCLISMPNASNNDAGLQIAHSGAGGSSVTGMWIQMLAASASGDGLIVSGSHLGRAGRFRLSNNSNVSTILSLDHLGNGPHIQMTGDPANSSSSDGDLWFDGTNLKINIAGSVFNIDMTAI